MIVPSIEKNANGRTTEIYSLPIDESYLKDLFEDIFRNYWKNIVFGPLVEGGAFEFQCPNAPTDITLHDGYLTVHFGGTHFHLCIGTNNGPPKNPTSPALKARRRTTRAEMFRRFDSEGRGVNSWGLQLFNGADEQLISVFFANPFLTRGDKLADPPDWSRLAMWEDIGRRYLGRELDALDKSSKGFV